MKSRIAIWRRLAIAGALAFLFLGILSIVPARAQNTSGQVQSVVSIDGAAEPDLIPDWILWRELFHGAILLDDKSPTRGRDIWMDRLGLTTAQMNQVIAFARTFLDEEEQIDLEVSAIVASPNSAASESTRSKLHQKQADKESRILAIRDGLRSRIGTEAFLKLQSFARLHIAPGVKVMKPPETRK
jgi:hypothetical protein